MIEQVCQHWNGKTVMIHGTEDVITPLDIADKLKNALAESGKDVSMWTYKGYGHFKMDEPARISTREVIGREFSDTYETIDYEAAVMSRIDGLKKLGNNVDLNDHDLRDIKDSARRTDIKLSAQKTAFSQSFVEAKSPSIKIDHSYHTDLMHELNHEVGGQEHEYA